MEQLLKQIADNRQLFSDEFVEWLQKNEHVWEAFVREATTVHLRGFQHYSARTIIHVLRHHSALQEIGTQWKISDHSSPYLARLFDLTYPEMAGMWTFKLCKTAIVDAIIRDHSENFNFEKEAA